MKSDNNPALQLLRGHFPSTVDPRPTTAPRHRPTRRRGPRWRGTLPVMRPELTAAARRQSGLVLRQQAVLAGYSERELRTRLAVHGPWTVVRRGVYVTTEQWQAATAEDRWRLRDRAVDLTTGVEHAMSCDSAARAHRLPLLAPTRPLSHLVRPGVWGSRSEHGVKHHLARLMPQPLIELDGMLVTPLGRTALDVAREHGLPTGVGACDAALRRGVTVAELEAELGLMTHWPHVTRARAAAAHADAGAENLAESLARLLVLELGLGAPTSQFPVQTALGLFWCDLQLGNHVVEFDGRVKYRPRSEGGHAGRSAEDVVWEEKRRERAIAAEGLGLSRVIWEDLWGGARVRALRRLEAEMAVSRERFGAELAPHLRANAARLTGARTERLRHPRSA